MLTIEQSPDIRDHSPAVASAFFRKEKWSVGVLLALATAQLLWKLGQNSLANWDESEYAQIAREMLLTGDYLTPNWGFKPKFHQPPLYVWFTVGFFKLVGINEFGARLASALSGIVLTLVTYFTGKLVFDKKIAFVGCLILLTSFGFVDNARFGTTDTMLALFIYLALYTFLLINKKGAWLWLISCLFMALAVMTKSAGGLLAPMIIFSLLLLEGRLPGFLLTKQFWLGILLFLAIILPWPIYMIRTHGQAFINDFFFYHILNRSANALEGNKGDNFFYIYQLGHRFYPWLYTVPFALAFFIKELLHRRTQALPLFVTAVLVFTLFTLVKTKLYWYVVPLYPALSLLVAAVLTEAIRTVDSVNFGTLTAMVLLAFLDVKLKAVGVVCFSVFLITIYVWQKRKPMYYISVALFLFSILMAQYKLKQLFSPDIDEVSVLASRHAGPQTEKAKTLLLYKGIDWPAALFYSNQNIKQVETPQQVKSYLTESRGRVMILAKKDAGHLASYFAIHTISSTNQYLLIEIKK